MHFYKLLPILLILAFGFFEPMPVKANATPEPSGKPIQVFDVMQQDLTEDGTPDVAIIDCAFATDHDRVLVYDPKGDMPIGNEWNKVTDFIGDTWVFDVGANGTAQLIVKFEKEGDLYTALVYDDLNGDGNVSYRIEKSQIIITESSFWHVKVESDHSWTKPDALFDSKFTFLIDGYTSLTPGVSGISGNDGVVDWQIEIGDKDRDGINDYILCRVVSPNLVQLYQPSLGKTTILAQMTGGRPTPYENTVFWPLLIGKHTYEDYRYFDHPPMIAINWATGSIDRYGILGFPIEAGYHIYSLLPSEKNTVNAVNFENPMAYYDMANDHDGWPELQVRFNYAVPNDPYFPRNNYASKIDTPNLEAGYSWDQNNDNKWDYKMELGGNYAIDSVVYFPDFSIKSIPYDEIVPWVKNKTWDIAMLIFDSHPSADSEGMFGKGWQLGRGYAGGKSIEPSGVNDNFMMGLSDKPPLENYQDIQEFMRGEYNFQYFDKPKIYLSAFDRQLHLYSAQSGVWNLGAGQSIHYSNLDGDAYLDQWQDQRNGIVVQQVNYCKDLLIYSGNGQILLKQTGGNPVLFVTQPPGNYKEWQRLDKQLKASQISNSPTDFTGMIEQLAGVEMSLDGAKLRDFRPISNGFRFIMELQSGYSFTGEDKIGLIGKTPGIYLVFFDGTYHLQPTTPPEIEMVNPLQFSPSRPLTAYATTNIQVTLNNQGLEDAQKVALELSAVQAGKTVERMDPQEVSVMSGQEKKAAFNWAPPQSGEWEIQVIARLLDDQGNELKRTSSVSKVQVNDPEQTTLKQELSAFDLVQPWQVLALILAVGLAAALTVWVLFRSHTVD